MPIVPFAFEFKERNSFATSSVSGSLAKASRHLSSSTASEPARKALFSKTCQHVSHNQLVSLMRMAPKDLWAYWQKEKALRTATSEQMLLARVLELGEEVFGEGIAFNSWLLKPAYGLAGKLPIDLLYIGGGIDAVVDELTRIALGDLA